MFEQIYHNSPVILYILQSATYCFAAAFSRRGDHDALTICYLTSALVHGLLGACQLMHLGRGRFASSRSGRGPVSELCSE